MSMVIIIFVPMDTRTCYTSIEIKKKNIIKKLTHQF